MQRLERLIELRCEHSQLLVDLFIGDVYLFGIGDRAQSEIDARTDLGLFT